MRDELVGVWRHQSDADGYRNETTITIEAEGCFITRTKFFMDNGWQVVEHRGSLKADGGKLNITLAEGFTQNEDGIDAGRPMKPFTEAEHEETTRMLEAGIPYRISESGVLITEPEGPAGKMIVRYTKVENTTNL